MARKIKSKKLDSEFIRFMERVNPESDPVTMILKCHLLVEHYLDKIIAAELTRGDIITDSNFQFLDKLLIVDSLDKVGRDLIQSCKKLNSTRNNCSHQLDYEISEAEIDKMGMPFGASYLRDKKQYSKHRKLLLHSVLLVITASICGCAEAAEKQRAKRGY